MNTEKSSRWLVFFAVLALVPAFHVVQAAPTTDSAKGKEITRQGRHKDRGAPGSISAHASAKSEGCLFLVGGGLTTDEIRRKFIDSAGGKRARIVVIPSASRRVSAASAAEPWEQYGVTVNVLHVRNRKEAARADLRCLDHATGVWIGGGDQARLVDLFKETSLPTKLQAVLARGGVLAGTSAGAMCHSRVMVLGRGKGRGFGLLDWSVDTHFSERHRLSRLSQLLGRDRVGVGIDESTALVVRGGQAHVLGRGSVTLVKQGTASELRDGTLTTNLLPVPSRRPPR